MRLALAVATIVPLLAGCLQAGGEDGVRREAFTAEYAIQQEEGRSTYTARVHFGDVVEYLDADGEVRQGYALSVDYGSQADRLCRGQSILDADFRLRRYMWGNGWSDGRCVHEQYDWPVPGGAWPYAPHFGIGLVLVPDAPLTFPDNQTYEFDGLLAPVRQMRGEHAFARRVSYTPLGPLPELAEAPLADATLLPSAQAGASGLPGGSVETPYGFSLDAAMEFLRANDADARALLDGGACLRAFHFLGPYATAPPSIPVWTASQTETQVSLTLADTQASQVFRVGHGRTAPFGEVGFTAIAPEPRGVASSWPCSERGDVAGLDMQMRLIQERAPGVPLFLYGIWQRPSADVPPWFQLVADTGRGRVQVHGSQGLLQSFHVQRDASIDP